MLLFQVALLSDESELAISLSLRLTHSYLMASNWQEAHEVLTSCPGVEVKITNIVFSTAYLLTFQFLRLPYHIALPPSQPSPFLGLPRGLSYVKNIVLIPGEHEKLAIRSANRLVGLVQMIKGN